ncbi:hypothetical protein HaLaN_03104 [Haematococcus lacustris]|uniref:Uncharacterized protein n=1 Tax=Haematococcus lacustris TaxID=44745 RepID=A0A699YDR9_HAELA|nr:hypothetical protein HaLaN_03104 [Haematococcus lacustris]
MLLSSFSETSRHGSSSDSRFNLGVLKRELSAATGTGLGPLSSVLVKLEGDSLRHDPGLASLRQAFAL